MANGAILIRISPGAKNCNTYVGAAQDARSSQHAGYFPILTCCEAIGPAFREKSRADRTTHNHFLTSSSSTAL